MASEQTSLPVNGTYGSQQHAGPSTSPGPNEQQSTPEISKDEVAWYFVERYYNTLSRTPDKLFLFYNKRSQFVAGEEAEKVHVYSGQRVSILNSPHLSIELMYLKSPSTTASRNSISRAARSASPTLTPRPRTTTSSSKSSVRCQTRTFPTASLSNHSYSLLRPTVISF